MADDDALLCVTHSPLVTRVCQAAIRQRNIPRNRVAWVGLRSTLPPSTPGHLDLINDQLKNAIKRGNRSSYQEARNRLFSLLEQVLPGPFNVLLPHTNEPSYREILAHPRCRGWGFVEEGFTCMDWESRNQSNLPWRRRLRDALRYRLAGAQPKRPMFDHAGSQFLGAYALSPRGFAGMPQRIDIRDHIPPFPDGEGRRLILVLDSSYIHRGVIWNDYLEALLDAATQLAPGHDALWLKFHFADLSINAHFQEIGHAWQRRGQTSTIQLLPADFSIEDHLQTNDTLLTGVSSLAYYAALSGLRVHSFAPALNGCDLGQWSRRGLLPDDFIETVPSVS
ncbi:hypothetical protein JO972_09635 [Verrucomicrobiaceae bacterium 5K15]|uniref:Uncharacterized protein n=1 Tax=Oceaniferula flava TaxID=2800421 RepID=A0AAE2SD56_9BACT|nr:hypothetical protein [Oceaniferula flavus]MBK1855217.1 hypothetical protein [Oceaniferula flavus]MBM1136523.1 hypothetical protein [Oceaniferula flavus]